MLPWTFTLSNEQRSWQMAARKFADEEIRPLSLARDAIDTARETWNWEIIRKGSRLGFRTLAVPKNWGGTGADFVTQGLVMAELAKGDSAMSKAFSQNWKWSHLIPPNSARTTRGSGFSSRVSSPTTPTCWVRRAPSPTPAPTTATRRTTRQNRDGDCAPNAGATNGY